jgi:hypothetical protein
MSRLGDDPGVVAPGSEQESNFRVGEKVNFVDRPPECDVVAERAHREYRNADVGEGDWFVLREVPAFRENVLQKELT